MENKKQQPNQPQKQNISKQQQQKTNPADIKESNKWQKK